MHQAGCGDAVLHYNYELGYGLWGEESIKAKKREQLALLHLPSNPHAPPEGGDKTDAKQGSLRFSGEEPSWEFLKAFYLEKGEETFGE